MLCYKEELKQNELIVNKKINLAKKHRIVCHHWTQLISVIISPFVEFPRFLDPFCVRGPLDIFVFRFDLYVSTGLQ